MSLALLEMSCFFIKVSLKSEKKMLDTCKDIQSSSIWIRALRYTQQYLPDTLEQHVQF